MDLLMRRREMMLTASGGLPPLPTEPALPEGYQRIEYVNRPDGIALTRAFNQIGFTPNGTDKLEIRTKFMFTSLGSSGYSCYVTACGQTTTDNTFGFGIGVDKAYAKVFAYGGESAVIEPNGGNSVKNVVVDVLATRMTNSISITDGTNSDTIFLTPRAIARQITVFGQKHYSDSNDRTQYPICGNIYYELVYEGGVLKSWLIPAKRLSDNRAGFYDVIMDAFRSSQYYVAGPVVE